MKFFRNTTIPTTTTTITNHTNFHTQLNFPAIPIHPANTIFPDPHDTIPDSIHHHQTANVPNASTNSILIHIRVVRLNQAIFNLHTNQAIFALFILIIRFDKTIFVDFPTKFSTFNFFDFQRHFTIYDIWVYWYNWVYWLEWVNSWVYWVYG